MKHLKTFENYISMAPKGMDQDLYFFLKEYLKDTKFEIRYMVGEDEDNVDDIHFVQEDGIDDDDKFVEIRDDENNKFFEDNAYNFNVYNLERNVNFFDNNDYEDTDNYHTEVNKILKAAIEEYKNTIHYQTKKYNI